VDPSERRGSLQVVVPTVRAIHVVFLVWPICVNVASEHMLAHEAEKLEYQELMQAMPRASGNAVHVPIQTPSKRNSILDSLIAFIQFNMGCEIEILVTIP
jgi:hypothetical protein